MIVAALVVMVIVMVVLTRQERGAPVVPGAGVPQPLQEALERAVAGGIISAEQASAIVEAERVATGRAPAGTPRLSPVTEAVAYLGGILAVLGSVLLAAQFWDDLETWSRLTSLLVSAAALLAGGAFVPEQDDAVFWRLRAVLWLLSTGALTFATALVAVDVAELGPEPVVFTTGAVVAVYDAVLWARRDRPLQHLATLVGLLLAAGGLLSSFSGPGGVGLVMWGIGGGWAWLGWRRLLPPAWVALALGSVTVLVGSAVTAGEWEDAAPVIGIATAVGLVAAGIALRERIVTAAGLCGVFIFLPWTAAQLFGETLGVPVIMLLAGLVVLAVTVALLRRQAGGSGRSGVGVGEASRAR